MAKKQTKRFSELGIQEKAEWYRDKLSAATKAEAISVLAAYFAAFDFVDTMVPENVAQIIGTMAAAADPLALGQVLPRVLRARKTAQDS